MNGPRRSRRTLIVAPLVALLVGGAAGWFMRDTAESTASDGTVVGHPLPNGAELDAAAPFRELPAAASPMIVDRTRLIGYPDDTSVTVPKGAVLPLARDASGDLTAVDPSTLQPVGATPAAPLPPVEPVPLAAATPPAAPPSTAAPPDATTTSSVATTEPPAFVDPCVGDSDPCPGAGGRVLDAIGGETDALDPLQISVPFAATGAYADMCNTIEAGSVPDPFLGTQVRPTIAVVANQPSSIALSGTWADGSVLEKLTMVTSAEFDQQWHTEWDTAGEQGLLLSCLTLPQELVRTHASAGRATLDADLLAISASGRTELGSPVTLSIPLDGEDLPFVDHLGIRSLGEQVQADGTLAPMVHVHYAVANDALVPPGSTLDQSTAKVYGAHEFVENADCSGWANNAQGLARTTSGGFTVTTEQRTVGGRTRPVTVVDGDLVLDPVQPGGWNGFVCVQLFAADDAGNRVTIALRGAAVRSPLSPTYSVGVVLDDPLLPAGWSMEATWTTPAGVWCGPVTLDATNPGGSCTTYARAVPGGITLVLRAVDETRSKRPALVVTVPVNAGYCTPDDPFAAVGDGCATGFAQDVRVPADAGGDQSVKVTLQVLRNAAPGSVETLPAHAWQIDTVSAFNA